MATPTKSLGIISKVKSISPLKPKISTNFDPFKKTVAISNNHHLRVPSVDLDNNCLPNLSKRKLLLNTPEKINIQNKGLDGKKDLKLLGHGTFGNVVRGIYNNGTDVAVKIIKINKENLLINRDRNALNLTHENVIKTLDVIIKFDQNYGIVVMEYLTNTESLQSILINKKNLLTNSKIKTYSIDICKGLKYCHENNILHLDLKPKNILVVFPDDICKICDFGNSIKIGEEINEFYGTPAYTAPEIFLGKSPSIASDIYSLAIIFWQMLEKELPYKHISCSEILIYKIVKFEIRPKINFGKNTSNTFLPLIEKCWSSKPEERPSLNYILETLSTINI